jgi:hypothetical protein
LGVVRLHVRGVPALRRDGSRLLSGHTQQMG